MHRIHLADRQWALIQPLLPPPARTGRPRADDRRTIDAILDVLLRGCRWQDLPRESGAPTTAWRRLTHRGEVGIGERIRRAALATRDRPGQLDRTLAFRDGSFVAATRGGEKVGLTRKGKGTKGMLVIDGKGLPRGFQLDGADCAAVTLAQPTLDTIPVTPGHAAAGTPQTATSEESHQSTRPDAILPRSR